MLYSILVKINGEQFVEKAFGNIIGHFELLDLSSNIECDV